MERAFKIGCRVIFFDSLRVAHDAIVTNWFHGGPDGQTVAEKQQFTDEANQKSGRTDPVWMPCCNVVYVSGDVEKKDPYGRQVERQTSCGYGRQQGTYPFVGMCWAWPDEEEEAKALAAVSYEQSVAR